jgi:hypothetical protein
MTVHGGLKDKNLMWQTDVTGNALPYAVPSL